jgi:hypothetical protein
MMRVKFNIREPTEPVCVSIFDKMGIHKVPIYLKMTIFWDAATCSVIEIGRSFSGVYCIHHQGLIMETVISSETLVNFY